MELFRRVMIPAVPLTRGQLGRLRPTKNYVRHPKTGLHTEVLERTAIFWFWVPPEKRSVCANRTRVPNATPEERLALMDGVIEEEWRVLYVDPRMPKPDLTAWLLDLWRARCKERLGYIPEIYRTVDVEMLKEGGGAPTGDPQPAQRPRIIFATG